MDEGVGLVIDNYARYRQGGLAFVALEKRWVGSGYDLMQGIWPYQRYILPGASVSRFVP